jgi:hypothetical protein
MTAGTRLEERNFLAPARRFNVRGNAVKATDFIFFYLLRYIPKLAAMPA